MCYIISTFLLKKRLFLPKYQSTFLEKYILLFTAITCWSCVTNQNVSILPNYRKIHFLDLVLLLSACQT